MEETASIEYEGRTFYFSGLSNDPITKYHLQHRTFYEIETLLSLRVHLEKEATPRFTVIDAGANIGNHSVFFSQAFPESTVMAFEMNPETHTYLESNLQKNRCSNVVAINKGLSNRAGVCGIRQNEENPLGGAQLDLEAGSGQVTLTTIDAELSYQDTKCAPVALIKVDVEGHELECLEGARTTLQTHRPLIFLECKETEEFSALSRLLEHYDYEIVEPAMGNLPNFLFVHRDRLPTFFTERALYDVRKDLCARHVAAWQLIRKIRKLEQEVARLRDAANQRADLR